jgi:small conductance mechanosensitive channel
MIRASLIMVDMWPSTADVLYNARVLSLRAVTAVAVFAGFYIASRILSAVIERLIDDDGENSDLLLLLARTAKIAMQVFGAVTALGTAGIDVSALVAGLGLTGFALGFAFRDVLSNVLAGVLILMYRPFRKGDLIAVSGLEGRVSGIDLRYTILEGDGKSILIPNSNLFTNPIVVTPAELRGTVMRS